MEIEKSVSVSLSELELGLFFGTPLGLANGSRFRTLPLFSYRFEILRVATVIS